METSFWDTAISFTVAVWRNCTDFLFQNGNLFLNYLPYLTLCYKTLLSKKQHSHPQKTPNKHCLNWIEFSHKPPKDSHQALNSDSESTDSKFMGPEFTGLFFTSSLKVPASVIYWVCFLHVYCSSLSPCFDLYYF